jgi:uncharacterized MAPEG superfamily protein
MTIELQYLSAVTILTLLLRIPWMFNKVTVRGLDTVTGYPLDSAPLDPWAQRLWIAHEDAVDNLVVFAALVLVLHVVGASSAWTQAAAAAYFWSRLVHFIVYAFAIPRIKTIAFFIGFGAQLVLAWHLAVLAWRGV